MKTSMIAFVAAALVASAAATSTPTATPTEECTSITKKGLCNKSEFSGSKCIWSGSRTEGECNILASCEDITSPAQCKHAAKRFDLEGCLWQGGQSAGVCITPTQCSDFTKRHTCNKALIVYGVSSCNWNNDDEECVLITTCDQIDSSKQCRKCKDATSTGTECKFSGLTQDCLFSRRECKEAPTACTSIDKKPLCNKSEFSGSKCVWSGSRKGGECTTEVGLEGFLSFLEVKCTDDENLIETLVRGVNTNLKCVKECEKTDTCNLVTYDSIKKECSLFSECGKPFEHKWIDGINEEDDERYDVEGFVTSGRVGENGYFVSPFGSYCKKTTGNEKEERACETMNESDDLKHFYAETVEECMELCDDTMDCIQGVWTPDLDRTCRLMRNPGGASLFLSRAGPESGRLSFKKLQPTTTAP